MNDRAIKVLEYEKIIKKLKDRASSMLGKGLAGQLKPFTNYEEVIQTQSETTDAVTCILRKVRHHWVEFTRLDHLFVARKQEVC